MKRSRRGRAGARRDRAPRRAVWSSGSSPRDLKMAVCMPGSAVLLQLGAGLALAGLVLLQVGAGLEAAGFVLFRVGAGLAPAGSVLLRVGAGLAPAGLGSRRWGKTRPIVGAGGIAHAPGRPPQRGSRRAFGLLSRRHTSGQERLGQESPLRLFAVGVRSSCCKKPCESASGRRPERPQGTGPRGFV